MLLISEACFCFKLGLCKGLLLITRAHHEQGLNPGSHYYEPNALPLTYPPIPCYVVNLDFPEDRIHIFNFQLGKDIANVAK